MIDYLVLINSAAAIHQAWIVVREPAGVARRLALIVVTEPAVADRERVVELDLVVAEMEQVAPLIAAAKPQAKSSG